MAPGEAKELLVRYLIDGAPHTISRSDKEGCHLPWGGDTAVVQDEEEGGPILRHVLAHGLIKAEAPAARGSGDGEEQVL